MIKKLLLAVCIAIAAIVLFIVLAFVAYIGYSVYANNKADQAAEMLCGNILRIGSEIRSVIDTAAKSGDRNRLVINEGEHRFIFYGAIFHSCEYVVTGLNGKVVSVHLRLNDD